MSQDLIASSASSVVVGLGATGLSCARYLQSTGAAFAVVDTRQQPPGLNEFESEFPDVPLFLGDIPPSVMESAAQLIVSPGVSLDEPVVASALDAGATVVGDIDLFVREAAAPVIGITGSNAKSTVTEWVGAMAREADLNVAVGGNLGVPALDLLSPDVSLYVLELSSFQLERAGKLNLAVATVLNLSADHLDRHRTMPLYHRAKHRIFQGCRSAVVNRDDALTKPLVSDEVKVVGWRMSAPDLEEFGLREDADGEYLCRGFERILEVNELGLSGRHNIANALAALAIGDAAGLPMSAMTESLKRFQGLPHRCELIATLNGVRYINDSKGTNTGATEAALGGLGGDKDILLIAGGVGKGADFNALVPAIDRHCKLLVLIGEASAQMRDTFEDTVETVEVATLEEAVQFAAARAVTGDCVLLSPACASFDMFSGYIQRGEVFGSAVMTLPGGAL